MMKTIVLEKEKIHCGNLLLVNAHQPLRKDDTGSLIPVDMRFPHICMRRDAANVFQLLLEKIAAGNSIAPVSGYRSSEEQTAIYDSSIQANGEDFTRTMAFSACRIPPLKNHEQKWLFP